MARPKKAPTVKQAEKALAKATKAHGGKLIRQCDYCGADMVYYESRTRYGKGKYCSPKCQYDAKRAYRVCKVCGKNFYIMKCESEKEARGHYCSYTCLAKSKEKKVSRICIVCEKEFFVTPCFEKVGNGRGSYCSRACKGIVYGQKTSGENNCNWKGGITPINHKIRTSKKYSKWRTSIIIRDEWICQHCGEWTSPPNTHVHHIKSFNTHPELRFDINNGITLCDICHDKLHIFQGNQYVKINS
ncbi:HNH endonuclease [Candidatus Dojkabacteria bacterium]|jgi:5-methylcytosine-specific restriction endonuclease McrA|nr:HNH endonuclease [Candidatus Dojkabacteria bacterium]